MGFSRPFKNIIGRIGNPGPLFGKTSLIVTLATLSVALAFPSLQAGGEDELFEISNNILNVEGWPVILGSRIFCKPAAKDIDGDGRDEVAVGMTNGKVALLGPDGNMLPGWPRETYSHVNRAPSIGDIDGDGEAEILAVSYDGSIFAWNTDGSRLDGWPIDLGSIPLSAPYIIESKSKGESFIMVEASGSRIFLIDRNGKTLPGWPKGVEGSGRERYDAYSIAGADMDHDGDMEILYLSFPTATLNCWKIDGSTHEGFPVRMGADCCGTGIAVDDPLKPRRIACTTHKSTVILNTDGEIIRILSPLPENDIFFMAPDFVSSGAGEDSFNDLVAATSYNGSVYLWDKAGRLLEGWPVSLRGFIFGLTEEKQYHSVHTPIASCDVDKDGDFEILMGSYDQHLYCFNLKGDLLPGFPVTLGDMNTSGVQLVEIDGKPGKELLVAQAGETIFAFKLGGEKTPGQENSPGAPSTTPAGEWSNCYFVIFALIAAMIFLIGTYLHKKGLFNIDYKREKWLSGIVAAFIILLLARALTLALDIKLYVETKREMSLAVEKIESIISDEERKIRDLASSLASDMANQIGDSWDDTVEIMNVMERTSDHYRLDYDYEGLAAADDSGRVIQAVGIARNLSRINNVQFFNRENEEAFILEGTPVLISEINIGSEKIPVRFFLFSSMLKDIPYLITDATGFANYITYGGNPLAYSESGSYRNDLFLWQGSVAPSLVIPVKAAENNEDLAVLLIDSDYSVFSSGLSDFAILLLFPVILILIISSRKERLAFGKKIKSYWGAIFLLIYLTTWILMARHCLQKAPLPIIGYFAEVLMHICGLTGIAIAIFSRTSRDRLKRLTYSLLGSYLVVSLIPLTLIILLLNNAYDRVHNSIVEKRIEELSDRANDMIMRYKGDYNLRAKMAVESGELLSSRPEVAWFNFVREEQALFTYEFPTAYLTLWATDRDDPGRYFTGFSYRAPRQDKLYRKRPLWTADKHPKGVFLDANRVFIRALSEINTEDLEVVIVSHIPIDNYFIKDLEKRIRLLPFMPKIYIEPTWLHQTSRPKPKGFYLPYKRTLTIPARDWNTGHDRWISLEATMYLPQGEEKWRVLPTVLLMMFLPFGLSLLGAYYTFHKTGRPLARLLTGIRRVETGNLDYRIGDEGQAEVAESAQAFNRMADSLEQKIVELAEKRNVEEVSNLKSRFISMISHDLKTPLSSIKGAADNIIEGVAGPVSDRQREYLQMILSSSDNLQGMLGNILDLSRIESGSLELERERLDPEIELQNIIRSMRPLIEEKELKIEINSPSTPLILKADRTRLWQILTNSLSNAVKFSPRGGLVRIDIFKAPDSRPEDAGVGEEQGSGLSGGLGRFIGISFTDQGPGIGENQMEKLFEPFYSRSTGDESKHGAGLGLAIVRQLVELHGGTARIENTEKGGARLSLFLPAED